MRAKRPALDRALDFERDGAGARRLGGELDVESLRVLRPIEFAVVAEQGDIGDFAPVKLRRTGGKAFDHRAA